MLTWNSFYTVEKFGRRRFIVYGLLILGVTNLIIGCLNVHPSHSKILATIALVYVWACVYQMSVGALGFTLASEVATISLRSETQSLVTVANAGFGWVFSFSIPYMINPDAANLGGKQDLFQPQCIYLTSRLGKIGFIFGSFGIICFVMGFFLFPETKGLTFAELDYLFANKVAAWNFTKVITERRAAGTFENDTTASSEKDSTEKGEVVTSHVETK